MKTCSRVAVRVSSSLLVSVVFPMILRISQNPAITASVVACACRKYQPRWSSGRSVLVKDSAKAILSSYDEAIDTFGLKSLGQGFQRCCCGQ